MIIKIEIQIDTENKKDIEKMQELYRIVEEQQLDNEGYYYDESE
jgi:hypothetical protein